MRTVWLVDNGDYWKAAWKDPGGKLKSKSLGSKAKFSRRQARVLCKQLERTPEARAAGKCPGVAAWLEQYVASRTDVKESTRNLYRDCALYLRTNFDDDPPIDQLTRADAADWGDALAGGSLTKDLNALEAGKAAGERRRTWRIPKLPTVRKHVRAAKLMFQQATDRDLILFNPFDRLKGASPKILKDWREVTAADMVRILETCPNAGWRGLFALTRYGGLRLEEALTLEWPDVDWGGNRMNVNEGIDLETTKKRFRVAPLEPARCPTGLTGILRTILESAPDGSSHVCQGVKRNNLRRTALGILRRSGVGVYAKPFHTLRKCRISEVALEYPQGILEEWFGHDEEVSRRHYQRVPEELYAPPNVQNGQSGSRKQRRTTAKRPGTNAVAARAGKAQTT